MALYYREYSPSNCLANGLFLAASLSMKQSGQKSKLCVTLIACFITSSGKIFFIFSRPSTYILHVAITDVAISEVVLCSNSLDAWLHACLRLSSPNAENIFKMATAVELVKRLARLTSGQTTLVRFPMWAQEKKIYFLAAFQCFGGHCKPSGQSAKSLSSSCFL